MTIKTVYFFCGWLLLWLPTQLLGHAGNTDLNGGHYWGQSYHCHMTGCEMPDTFDFGRRSRDSLLTDYRRREKFFNEDDWSFEEDFDGDCQSTRQEMLILTSRSNVRYTNPRNCVVRTGQWLDEYTGETFEVAVKIEVDHVIPRMYAHTHGGDRWMPEQKLQFSNDPLNIMLVERREIRRKRDRGPSRYLPRDEFQCEYVNLWNQISEKYNLQLSASDRSTISRIKADCLETTIDQNQDQN
ncbi:MAG: hypothetical protein CMQ00_00360 [Gammaproteobacteria bacterium]|nr:hypothetical protein [Gammaproteobacteria bacterium]OUV78566.1 MAG: hypothetical protein CBC99_00360 [Gammaproteobacteria bacterium TMED139]|tara:strand:+ start:41 stop:763 length:723 start_codon:yes stop_codon:yes gene_type:complete